MSIVICSGGFDPIHGGHLAYLQAASGLGADLIVGVNSDAWLERKKGLVFMPFGERLRIVQALKCVDYAVGFDDSDNSARMLIRQTRLQYPETQLIFANGGDRTHDNIPEMDLRIGRLSFVFGVGSFSKFNSSSDILDRYYRTRLAREFDPDPP